MTKGQKTEVKVKSIPGAKNYYVTDTGEVYRCVRLKQHKNRKGYWRVRLSSNTRGRVMEMIHRLVMELFSKELPSNYDELQVNHKDKDKSNNDDTNLEIVTQLENISHRDTYKKAI